MLQLLIVLLISSPIMAPMAAAAQDTGLSAGLSAIAGTRTEVYVTDMEGLERKGYVTMAGEDGVHLAFAGRETVIPWSEVAIVERRGDPVWDGALKGAAISAAVYGVALLLADDAGGSEGRGEFLVESVVVWTGIGTVLDALHTGRSRVFVSPRVTTQSARRPDAGPRFSGIVMGARLSF